MIFWHFIQQLALYILTNSYFLQYNQSLLRKVLFPIYYSHFIILQLSRINYRQLKTVKLQLKQQSLHFDYQIKFKQYKLKIKHDYCFNPLLFDKTMIEPYNDQRDTLISILTCFICQEKATEAHICPNCSKFFCLQCIKKWIVQKSQNCPYCSQSLKEKQLVNCQKLCLDLSNALETMKSNKNKNTKICQQHHQQICYYCKNCEIQLCQNCCVVSDEHKKHEVVKYKEAVKLFDKWAENLKCRLSNAKKSIQQITQFHKNSKFSNNQIVERDTKKLNSYFKNLRDKINKKIIFQTNSITNKINYQKKIIEQKNQLYEQSLNFINTCPKIHFVSIQAQNLIEKLSNHITQVKQSNAKLQQTVKQFQLKPLQSETLPAYNIRTFILNNYSHLCRQNQLIYSQTLYTYGLQWRLKIYPSGNENQQPCKQIKHQKNIMQSYASIFIQLKSSLRLSGKYRHKIILQNPKNANKNLQRQFQSQFVVGECWGYDKFVKISYLYDHEFIQDNIDQLKITLMIAPANYYEASQDIKAYIKQRKENLQNLKQKKLSIIQNQNCRIAASNSL